MKNKEVEFNIGDKVVLKEKGNWLGIADYGVITEKFRSVEIGCLYCYKVNDSNFGWEGKNLELYKEEEEIEFNVGDKVVFKEGGALSKERQYVVITSKIESKIKEYKYAYKIEELTHSYYYDELELYKEEEKEVEFRIGDKVISKNCNALSNGSEYMVITNKGESSLERYKYYYRVKGVSCSYYHYDELELYKEKEGEKKEIEFNVGDKVVFKYNGTWGNGDKYKKIIRKDKIETFPGYYIYKYGVEGSDANWYYDELVLYKENNKTTLTDFSTKELNEKLKTLEKERREINKAIREKKKLEEEEKEKNDLKVALKTIIKRMEELGMNVSELIKD